MALQSSGPISLGDVQGEFGGSNPISISEYYGVDTGVPGSGTISLSDFYGTSNADVTMNTLLWTPDFLLGPGSDTATATVSGINTTVTLSIYWDGGAPLTAVQYRVNSGSYVNVPAFTTVTFNVNNGDSILINYLDNNSTGTAAINGNITIRNTSDGNTIVGNLSVSTYSAGGGGV